MASGSYSFGEGCSNDTNFNSSNYYCQSFAIGCSFKVQFGIVALEEGIGSG
tara:strand:- start:1155 stop:1307 length:153 start_codon:yes stop_codon:yes gene_type:complete